MDSTGVKYTNHKDLEDAHSGVKYRIWSFRQLSTDEAVRFVRVFTAMNRPKRGKKPKRGDLIQLFMTQ